MPDTNAAARAAVLFGLGNIPTVGGLVSTLVGLFWPASGVDVWSAIRARVEALINEKIAEAKYQEVSEDLQGVRNVVDDYTTALQDSQADPAYISDKYAVALGHFEAAQPHFQSEGYEVLLLPLLAQMANLHLALLRDGVTFGAKWGWTPTAVQDEGTKLRTAINGYVNWANTWYQTGLNQIQYPGDSSHRIENWRAGNQYVRQMTMDVLDHAHFWPAFDPAVNPGGDPSKIALPTRTIYSDPIGTADDTGIQIPAPPTGPITGINIWAWDRLDAIQVSYGPTSSARMGDQDGGSNSPPHGWSGNISSPVVAVTGLAGDIVNAVQLFFKDGSATNVCGGNYQGGNGFDYQYEGHVLGTILVMGVSNFYGSANCMVLGFRLDGSYVS